MSKRTAEKRRAMRKGWRRAGGRPPWSVRHAQSLADKERAAGSEIIESRVKPLRPPEQVPQETQGLLRRMSKKLFGGVT